jgi:hypothetical protein
MVLAVMVGFLMYRVYQVVNPIVGPEARLPSPPRSNIGDDVDRPGLPPPPPPPPRTDDWSRLWRFNPFEFRQPRASRTTDGENPADVLEIRLLRITPSGGGKFRAQIATPGRTAFYEEGQSFESYELLEIDPDAGTVTIFSEGLQKTAVLELESP